MKVLLDVYSVLLTVIVVVILFLVAILTSIKFSLLQMFTILLLNFVPKITLHG